MISKSYELWTKEEYNYHIMGEFLPNITTYIHDEDDDIRPAIIIVPGGGYAMVSPTEGEIVAKEFYDKGYNTFVLTYSTNFLMNNPLRLQPLKDLSKGVVFIRKNSNKFNVDVNKVVICGFSSGGHLCGSLAVHFDIDELNLNGEYEGISNKPNAVILSYPVISSGEYAHTGSFVGLFGENGTSEEFEFMSLEKQVDEKTPPIFIWHTANDNTVPLENTLLFVDACIKKGVKIESHIFLDGPHGLSLANEEWAKGNFGEPYTVNQFVEVIEHCVKNNVKLPSPFDNFIKYIDKTKNIKEQVIFGMGQQTTNRTSNKSVSIWPILAKNWINNILN